ncbi:MAG: hypothetical protein ACQETL_10790 [Bacteroidota bacterium]
MMKKLSLIILTLLFISNSYAQDKDIEILADGEPIIIEEGIILNSPPKHLSLSSEDFNTDTLTLITMSMARGKNLVVDKKFSNHKDFSKFDFNAWLSENAEVGDRIVFELEKSKNPLKEESAMVIVLAIN